MMAIYRVCKTWLATSKKAQFQLRFQGFSCCAAAALMNRYSRQPALTDVVKCGNSAQCAAKQKLRQLQLFYEFAEHNRRRWRWPNASTSQSQSQLQSTSLPASATSFCKESVNLMSSSGSSGKPHFWGTHCTLYTVDCVWCVQRVACAVIATSCSNRKQKRAANIDKLQVEDARGVSPLTRLIIISPKAPLASVSLSS